MTETVVGSTPNFCWRCHQTVPFRADGYPVPHKYKPSKNVKLKECPGGGTKKMKLPDVKAAVIAADAAWTFKAGTKGRPQHYKRMTLDEIKAMPVKECAAPDCWLFFWTTGPHLKQAFEVIDAWGFKYSSMAFVWIKLNKRAGMLFWTMRDVFMGQGYTTRKNAEFCILAKRGKPKRISKVVHEVIISPRREHSRKPDEFFDRVEKFADGPFLELFSRESRKGLSAWGDESNKFDT